MLQMWPFIVTRNQFLDWRAIYAPPFLIQAKRDFALVLETANVEHQEALTVRRVLAGTDRFTLVFRSRPITMFVPDIEGSDRFGRPIHVVEGVVLRGEPAVDNDTVAGFLDDQQAVLTVVIASYWPETDEGHTPTPSDPHVMESRAHRPAPSTALLAESEGVDDSLVTSAGRARFRRLASRVKTVLPRART